MTRDEKGTSYDVDMPNNNMKVFGFLAIQVWIKYIYLKKIKGKNTSACLEEHERGKNHPTCEKSSEISFSIDEEITNKFVDHMVRVWKKFWPKEDENSQYKPLKEEAETHEVEHQSPQGDCREGEPIDGCSDLYVGDIEITFEDVSAR